MAKSCSVSITGFFTFTSNWNYITSVIIADLVATSWIVMNCQKQLRGYEVAYSEAQYLLRNVQLSIAHGFLEICNFYSHNVGLMVFTLLSVNGLIALVFILYNTLKDTFGKSRSLQSYEARKDYLMFNQKHSRMIHLIKEHIQQYYSNPIDKYTIAIRFGMNADYLCKIFKKEEGISIQEYVNTVRIQKALYLLLHTNKKIIDVAFEVGYDNLATFYRHFYQKFNTSPRQIRYEYR